MVRTAVVLAMLLLLPVHGAVADNVAELKAKAEAAQGQKRAELFADLAYEYVELADHHFTEGRPGQGHATVELVLQAAERAREAALDLRRKIKKTELKLRKTSRKLEDVRRSLAFEDQAPVGKAVERLHQIQDELLEAMFAPKKREEDKS